MKKIAGFFLLLLSIAALGLWWITDHVLPYAPIRPHRVQLEQQPEFAAGTLPSDFGLAYDTFSVHTFDSLTLQGYYIPAPDAIATVVLLHGIGGCKEHFYALSRQLNDIGCNAVLFGRRNFDRLASQKKYFELVAGAGHLNLHQVGGEEYWGKLAAFILENARR